MNFKNKIDFCIIPSPFSGGLKNLIFVAYHGTNKLDEKLCLESDYELVRNLLNDCGFQEIDFCTFQSVTSTAVERESLANKLITSGLRYSKPFEFNIMGQFDSYSRDIGYQFETEDYNDNSRNLPALISQEPTFNIDSNSSTKFKIPAIGKRVQLSFYLFVQCRFITENDCILELVGDLYNKDNNNTRNLLKICTSDFVRLESKSPDVVLLQSTKSYSDLLNEVSFLHKGSFRYSKVSYNSEGEKVQKNKDYLYSILEIRKNINPSHRIIVEVNVAQYWDDMIRISKIIKKESTSDEKKIISLESLKPDINQLKQKINDRMLALAATDEFEKAASLKRDINLIDSKLELIESLEERNITKKEFSKLFCIG